RLRHRAFSQSLSHRILLTLPTNAGHLSRAAAGCGIVVDWHRLFGLVLTDFFSGSPFVVELEKDLSLKKQLLDVIVLRKYPGAFPEPLPQGLEDLAVHNLITFKSHQETLDDWALKELTGHYVNYRKQVSPSLQQLLPEEEFRLYAVCARFP